MVNKRIAIIGAGPSGAIALDSFLAAGFTDVVVFERHRVVGGTWNLDEDLGIKPAESAPGLTQRKNPDPPTKIPEGAVNASVENPVLSDGGASANGALSHYAEASLYPEVETNVTAELMSFSKRPFPKIVPPRTRERFGADEAFVTQDVVRKYVTDFYKGREQYVRLNTAVEKAWQPEGPGGRWKLTLQTSNAEWYSEEFDFVYVASGRFSVPYIPEIEGLDEVYARQPEAVLHTKVFRNPAQYRDKRLVLVGSGWSNVDVALLAKDAGVATPVYLAARSVLPVAVAGFAQPWIEAHPPAKNVSVAANGKLAVTFEDGATVSDVDFIILGTGYRYSYPFLAEYLEQYGGIHDATGARTKNLYWSTWWKYDPSLAVSAGITDSVFWRFLEQQAVATAGLWSRPRESWPTLAEAEEWEAQRESKGLQDFHTWWPHFPELFSGIAKVGGYEAGDVSIYLPLFERGFALKSYYWTSLAKQDLEKHPEHKERYDRTRALLEARQVTQIGL